MSHYAKSVSGTIKAFVSDCYLLYKVGSISCALLIITHCTLGTPAVTNIPLLSNGAFTGILKPILNAHCTEQSSKHK